MDPTIPLNLDDGRLVLLAMAVRFLSILLVVLMCVGCHEHGTYSNVMRNSTKNVGKNKLVGTPGLGSLQQSLKEEQKSSVACMDPTIPLNLDDRSVSYPAWSVKREGSSKCECGNDLHWKVTYCQNLEKLLIFQCSCMTYDNITDRVMYVYLSLWIFLCGYF